LKVAGQLRFKPKSPIDFVKRQNTFIHPSNSKKSFTGLPNNFDSLNTKTKSHTALDWAEFFVGCGSIMVSQCANSWQFGIRN
jgi:hypothetical protein